MEEEVNKFRNDFDNDKGLQTVRKLLITVCMTFLALNLTGASIEEANTFIFKIKFSNYKGLSYLLASTIVFLTIRYYSFAQPYHKIINDYWIARLMADRNFFDYNKYSKSVSGLLGDVLDQWGEEYPGLEESRYKSTGFFRRHIEFDTVEVYEDEQGRKEHSLEIIEKKLYEYSKNWTPTKYFIVLLFEFRYQINALFKHRENLDLFAPYILSTVTIFTFLFKDLIISAIS